MKRGIGFVGFAMVLIVANFTGAVPQVQVPTQLGNLAPDHELVSVSALKDVLKGAQRCDEYFIMFYDGTDAQVQFAVRFGNGQVGYYVLKARNLYFDSVGIVAEQPIVPTIRHAMVVNGEDVYRVLVSRVQHKKINKCIQKVLPRP